MKITKELIVFGKVQGVGFRAFVKNMANAFDICGYVKNLEDGSVIIIASGTLDNHKGFREQIEIGNFYSKTDKIVTTELGYKPFVGFEILK